MSNPKSGKLGFLKACDLLTSDMRKFIQKLSEMRNHAVHDIRNLNFSFKEHRESIDAKERKAFDRVLAMGISDVAFTGKEPKTAVWSSYVFILIQIFQHEIESVQAHQRQNSLGVNPLPRETHRIINPKSILRRLNRKVAIVFRGRDFSRPS